MKVIVFDLGGTLMQYVGMPHSWVEFYQQGFEAICRKVRGIGYGTYFGRRRGQGCTDSRTGRL